jgi:hypothetical protein
MRHGEVLQPYQIGPTVYRSEQRIDAGRVHQGKRSALKFVRMTNSAYGGEIAGVNFWNPATADAIDR